MTNRKTSGFTLVETFTTLALFAFLISMSVPGVKSFLTRMSVTNGLRTVTVAFSKARYLAIGMNKRVKVTLSDRKILLMEMKNKKWEAFKSFELDKNIIVSMNAFPVFSPYGEAAPLCTVSVLCQSYQYKITLSMAGRILVTKL